MSKLLAILILSTGALFAADDESVITIYQLNNAPFFTTSAGATDATSDPIILSGGAYTLHAINGRTAISVTIDPAILSSRIDDNDLWASEGIAVVEWNSLISTPPAVVSSTNAKLYPMSAGANSLSFTFAASDFGGERVDDATWPAGLSLLRAHAWDQTDGKTTFANPNPNGGRTAYSSVSKWIQVQVFPGGDDGYFVPGDWTPYVATAIPAPYALHNTGINPTNSGRTVDAIIREQNFRSFGIAITGYDETTVAGQLQYRVGASGSWTDFPALTPGQALLLDNTCSIRFGPAGDPDGSQPDIDTPVIVNASLWAQRGSQALSGSVVTLASRTDVPLALPGQFFDLIPVNDEPSVVDPVDGIGVPINAGLQVVELGSELSPGAPDESAQILTAEIVSSSLSRSDLFSVAPAFDSQQRLTFTPGPGVTGLATIVYHVRDDGGTAWGGDDTSPDYSITILVGADLVVPAPYPLLNAGVNPLNTGLSIWGVTQGFADPVSDLPKRGLLITGLSSSMPAGTWQYQQTSASAWLNLPAIASGNALCLDHRARIRFVPSGPSDGTQPDLDLADAVRIRLWLVDGDQGTSGAVASLASLGAASGPSLPAIDLDQIPINDEPSILSPESAILIGATGGPRVVPVFAGVGLGAPDETAQTWAVETVSSAVPGGLLVSGPSWDASGNLVFEPVSGATGSFSVTYQVRDSGGVAWGGDELSSTASVTVTVMPGYTVSAPYALLNSGANPANTGATMPDIAAALGRSNIGMAITRADAPSADGRLQYRLTSALPWIDLPAIPAASCLLLDARASVRYLPTGPSDGTQPDRTLGALADVRTWEVAGAQGASGSVVTIASRSDLGSQGLVVNAHLIPINDEPAATGRCAAVVSSRFGGSTSVQAFAGLAAGAPDEGSQSIINATVLSVGNPALFSVQPSLSTVGVLTFTPAGSTGTTTVSWRIQDSGGTAWGGDDLSPTYSTTITLDDGRIVPAPYALRNIGINPHNAGVTIDSLTTAIGEPGQGLALTWLDSSAIAGQFQYQVVGNGWSDIPTLSAGQAFLLDATAHIRFVPAGAIDGSQPDLTSRTIAARSWTTVPAQVGSVVTLNSITAGTAVDASVHAIPVNDQPTITDLTGSVSSPQNASVTRSVWTTINRGAPDENSQGVNLINILNSNPGLFTTGPTLLINGTLSYTPAPDTEGIAVLTFQVQDDGGTGSYGGVDTSPIYTVTISIAGGGGNATILSPYALKNIGVNPYNSGRSVADLLTDYGVPDAVGLVVSDADLTSIPGILQWKPAGGFWQGVSGLPATALLLDRTSIIRFGPRGLASGEQPAITAARIVSVLTLDTWPSGAHTGDRVSTASLPGTPLPASISFQLIPVNDQPYVQDVNWSTRVPLNPGARTAQLYGSALAGPPDEVVTQTTSVEILSIRDPNLFLVQPSSDSSGRCSFTAKNNVVGATLVKYRVRDDGGNDYGGVSLGKELPFIINIGEVNSPPILEPQAQQVIASVGVPVTIVISAYEPDNERIAAAFARMSQLGAVLGPITATRQSGVQQPWTVSFTYLPRGVGTETLRIPVTDPNRLESVATVTITVQPLAPIYDRPTIVSRPSYWWQLDGTWSYTLVTERERLGLPAALTYELVDAPATALISGSQIIWDTVNADLVDGDPVYRFIFKVLDSNDRSRYDVQQVFVAPGDRSLRQPTSIGGGG